MGLLAPGDRLARASTRAGRPPSLPVMLTGGGGPEKVRTRRVSAGDVSARVTLTSVASSVCARAGEARSSASRARTANQIRVPVPAVVNPTLPESGRY